jgi:hypothetical protein
VMPAPVVKSEGGAENAHTTGVGVEEIKGLELGSFALRLDDVLKFVSAGVVPAGR